MPEPAPTIFERIGGRAELLHLLRHFYADVRQHELLGPIFNAHIKDWPAHHEKLRTSGLV
ncbi:MAG: truncated hemoglobin [Opitutaceae bacterium]